MPLAKCANAKLLSDSFDDLGQTLKFQVNGQIALNYVTQNQLLNVKSYLFDNCFRIQSPNCLENTLGNLAASSDCNLFLALLFQMHTFCNFSVYLYIYLICKLYL